MAKMPKSQWEGRISARLIMRERDLSKWLVPLKAVRDISSVKACELEITLLPLRQFVFHICIWIGREN